MKRLVLSLLATVTIAAAVPRYALRDGVGCSACHLNPGGGGMRTPYAARRFTNDGPDIDLGEYVRVDADLRVFAVYEEAEDDAVFGLTAMDYRLRVNPRLDGLVDGVVGVSRFGLDDAWARVYLPADLYLRFGRFRPPFGLNTDDHNPATKSPLGYPTASWYETGLEAGWSSGGTHLALGLYNGRGENTDSAPGKALNARATQRLGPLLLGASYHADEWLDDDDGRVDGVWGLAGFFTLDLPADLGLLGEVVFQERREGAGPSYTDDLAFWVGAGYWLGPVELLAAYDQLIPGEESGSPTAERQYLTGRLIWHVHSFFDAELGLRYGLHDEATNHYLLQLRSVF